MDLVFGEIGDVNLCNDAVAVACLYGMRMWDVGCGTAGEALKQVTELGLG